jgi:hypothetical protein
MHYVYTYGVRTRYPVLIITFLYAISYGIRFSARLAFLELHIYIYRKKLVLISLSSRNCLFLFSPFPFPESILFRLNYG